MAVACSLVALALAVLAYGWASQVPDGPTRRGTHVSAKHGSRPWLRHHEAHWESWETWITESDVCGLGKFAFVAWVAALALFVTVPRRRASCVALSLLLALTVALSALMNPPLAVRATPAFVAIAAVIVLR